MFPPSPFSKISHSRKKIVYLTKYRLFRETWNYTCIIRYNVLHFVVHIENMVPLVTFINNFSVVFSFQNLQKILILLIFYKWFFFSRKAIFFLSKISHSSHFMTASPFLTLLILKNFLYPSPYTYLLEVLPPTPTPPPQCFQFGSRSCPIWFCKQILT